MSFSIKKNFYNKSSFSARIAEKKEAADTTPVISRSLDPTTPSTPPAAAGTDGFQLSLQTHDLLNGIILSEVLGKPKCMRRGR